MVMHHQSNGEAERGVKHLRRRRVIRDGPASSRPHALALASGSRDNLQNEIKTVCRSTFGAPMFFYLWGGEE